MIGIIHQGLGLLAGTIVTSAAFPRVMGIVRDISKAKGEWSSRNALLVTGNLVLVAYSWGDPFSIMAALNSALNGFILCAAVRTNYQRPKPSAKSPVVVYGDARVSEGSLKQ